MNTEIEYLHIYVRVSTEAQAQKGYSLKEQIELGKRKATELNMSPIVYSDSGISASGDQLSNRPELLRLIKAVKNGDAKNLFVFDQTRLSRNDYTRAMIFHDLKKHNIRLFTKDKEYDFKSLEDELVYKIMGVISDYDSNMRKARFQIGNVQANKQGKFTKPIPPYGYKKDKDKFLVFDEEEKAVVLKIFRLYKSGKGTGQIANELNSSSIPTKTQTILKNGYTLNEGKSNRKRSVVKLNNEWNPGTILSMIKNSVYYGQRQFKNGDNYEFTECPAIITKKEYDELQSIRRSNSINKRKEDKYFYLLKGLIQCSCGNSMHGRIKPNRGEYTYRCNSKRNGSGCGSRGINIHKLNDIVWFLFTHSNAFRTKAKKTKIEKNLSQRINKIVSQIGDLEKKKTKIESYFIKLKKHLIEENLDIKDYNNLKLVYQKNLDSLNDEIGYLINQNSNINEQKANSLNQSNSVIKLITSSNKVLNLYDPVDEIKMKEVQKIFFESIENIEIKWNNEKHLHDIEIIFTDKSMKVSNTEKFKKFSILNYIELDNKFISCIQKEYKLDGIKILMCNIA